MIIAAVGNFPKRALFLVVTLLLRDAIPSSAAGGGGGGGAGALTVSETVAVLLELSLAGAQNGTLLSDSWLENLNDYPFLAINAWIPVFRHSLESVIFRSRTLGTSTCTK